MLKFSKLYLPDGQIINNPKIDKDKYILFPGSFNPLHEGHTSIAEKVSKLVNKQVIFYINIDHPRKGSIEERDLNNRIKQFAWKYSVLITEGLPLYFNKANEFLEVSFIIGIDSLRTMLESGQYSFSNEGLLRRFNYNSTKFYVIDRQYKDKVDSLEVLVKENSLINQFKALFIRVPCSFYFSSTEIRKQREVQ